MKKKIIFIFAITFLIYGCNSYTPKSVNNKYLKLSKNLDILMNDEIAEKKRARLEKNFERFARGMIKYKEKNTDLDTKYLNYYIRETNIKLQYLKDLKD